MNASSGIISCEAAACKALCRAAAAVSAAETGKLFREVDSRLDLGYDGVEQGGNAVEHAAHGFDDAIEDRGDALGKRAEPSRDSIDDLLRNGA
ncbi:hypothetical protein [Mesorhizobium sp.]|uniref:hypothetical protein n=1 Tax=Mesorhizobium sp. TaxID=1871066 RepID=UPI000FE8BBB1|nr:hypothetical protein [Mesorhizobium sp.]RWA59466.1 MAG: hypothetical protein EOQ27_26470 [Mesorhizobium sp.]